MAAAVAASTSARHGSHFARTVPRRTLAVVERTAVAATAAAAAARRTHITYPYESLFARDNIIISKSSYLNKYVQIKSKDIIKDKCELN